MKLEELQKLLDGEEWTNLEFKEAKNQVPNDVWKTVSAFSNTEGGHIIFGVKEIDNKFEITGVQNLEKIQNDFLSTLRGKKFNIALSAKPERLEYEGKKILVFYVPPMPRQTKPIYYGDNPNNTYLRLASGDYRCSDEEIKRMMREASEQSSDTIILEGYDINDIDESTVLKYRNYLSSYDATSPLLGLSLDAFYRRLGIWRKDRINSQEGLTLAGLLLFGKSEAIQEKLPSYEIQYYYQKAPRWGDEPRWDDRLICQENLIETFLSLMERIKRHHDSPFYMPTMQRQAETPVIVAIREALVNLIIHQDYFERKIAQIRHSPQSIELINPGASQITDTDDLYEGNLTAPRNPIIAKVFRIVGWAELAGTGLLKIFRNWQQMNFELPKIENDLRRHQFRITLNQQHLIDEEDKLWVSRFAELNDQEKLILVATRKYGFVTNSQIRILLGIQDTLSVSQMLSKLSTPEKPYLTKIGTKGPTVRYELSNGIDTMDNVLKESTTSKIDGYAINHQLDSKHIQILRFCTEPKSRSEIMNWLGHKDRSSFVGKYLKILLEKELLKMTHPESPKHSSQKYYTNPGSLSDILEMK
ncbi:hypothetical protein F9B85_06560 [Heliorestis acidaminivorans]|uniref:AAA family ATPase n=1 Tax=Heliorestis acidaminivorans TaxID=553427 RepID=A0A6I0ESQ8_9FIRM|nr:RNA-binding domain-containing protein [Heliorestis acidaminivorans]KAB2952928.1 hypothetical protein F9B85_06560 [Heliorestis acidaminivorans]